MNTEDLAVVVPAVAGALGLLVVAACLRAMRTTGNRAIGFVAAGFSIFALKSAAKAWHLRLGPESLTWEVAFSLLDLLAVGLIAWPVIRAWGRGPR